MLTWQPLSLDKRNGIIHKYRVTFYQVTTNSSEANLLETNETSIEIPNLHPFYLYELLVAAETRAGVGPNSQPLLHQLPEARKNAVKASGVFSTD